MNKHFKFTNHKTMVTAIAAIGLTATLSAISFIPRSASGEFDINGITSTLENHEARIDNTEKDVTKLQESTNTSPAQDRVSVPQTSGTTTNPSPAPAQVQQPSGQVENSPEVTKTGTKKVSEDCVNGKTHVIWEDSYSNGTTQQRSEDQGSCVIVP